MMVEVSALPQPIGRLLRQAGYRRKRIGISAADTFVLDPGGDRPPRSDLRFFVAMADLATGKTNVRSYPPGSGPDRAGTFAIGPQQVAVKGTSRGAMMYTPIRSLLPARSAQLSRREELIFVTIATARSQERRRIFEANAVGDGEVDALVRHDLVKRSATGSLSLTERGKTYVSAVVRPSPDTERSWL